MITIKVKIQETENDKCSVTLVGVPKKDFEKATPMEKQTCNVMYSNINELLKVLEKQKNN